MRICWWSSRSPGPGSMPSPSTSAARAAWYASSASAWRPDRYSASISWARRCSRSGCRRTSASSSPISSACRPSARSSSTRCSRHARRSSSRRAISGSAKRWSAKSASGSPRHSCERLRRLSAVAQELEAGEIELVRLEPQQVSARFRLQTLPSEHLAQLRDVDLQRLSRRLRRLLVPEGLDQPLVRDHAVRVHCEHGERGTLLGAAEVERPPVVEHFERAEDAEIHRLCLAVTLAPAFRALKERA